MIATGLVIMIMKSGICLQRLATNGRHQSSGEGGRREGGGEGGGERASERGRGSEIGDLFQGLEFLHHSLWVDPLFRV